jgi:PD-(D/E)XK nuclease superfamily protein
MLTSDQKGAVAEAAIAHAAIELGIGVARPLGDQRYDLIFDLCPGLLRVQCKWAERQGEVILVRCYSSRRSREGLVRRLYAENEIDAIAAYCPDLSRCYFLPYEIVAGRAQLSLRLEPTQNGQALGVRWGDSFDFTKLDWESIKGP